MLKVQMALIGLLISCVVFISCDQLQELLAPAAPEEMMPEEMMPEETTPEEMTPEETTPEEMMPEETMAAYASWANVTYAAVSPAHGTGDRVVYINDVGVMALGAGMTTFPVGTVVVKEIMDDTNTAVAVVERMEKTDDPMYATEDGWLYNDGTNQAACHGCHATAGTDPKPGMDAVFTIFPMADMGGGDTDGEDTSVVNDGEANDEAQ